MALNKIKKHKFEFLVLEIRPEGSRHPQGNRVLECLEFSQNGMRLEGKPRFESFHTTLSIPQNGARVEAEVRVKHRADTYFDVEFVEPSAQLIAMLSWWDHVEPAPTRPSRDRNADIDA